MYIFDAFFKINDRKLTKILKMLRSINKIKELSEQELEQLLVWLEDFNFSR